MADLRQHYAQRIFRSVEHLAQTVWQPLCGYGQSANIRMTTVLEEVRCQNCQNRLVRHARRLGLSKEVNKITREGGWHETTEK